MNDEALLSDLETYSNTSPRQSVLNSDIGIKLTGLSEIKLQRWLLQQRPEYPVTYKHHELQRLAAATSLVSIQYPGQHQQVHRAKAASSACPVPMQLDLMSHP